jgi:predicted MFS family arabinose efflux permease
LIPSMMKDFGISHTQAGLLMSILFVPGVLVSIPAVDVHRLLWC